MVRRMNLVSDSNADSMFIDGEVFIDDVRVKVSGFPDMTVSEAEYYLHKCRDMISEDEKGNKAHSRITSIALSPSKDGSGVAIDIGCKPPEFERIRRITGYLTGSVKRWNNAKRAEERERVKHSVDSSPSVDDCGLGL